MTNPAPCTCPDCDVLTYTGGKCSICEVECREIDPRDCEGTAVPVCPNCGEEMHDWWDGLDALKRDGDDDETDCGSCEKPFKIVMHVSTTFTTRKKTDDTHD